MIWVVMGIFVLGVLLYAAWPLYAKTAPNVESDSEVTNYLGQIADIDKRLENADEGADVAALKVAKLDLQRQVLAKTDNAKDAGPQAVLLSTLFIVFAFGAMGLYATLGSPELTKAGALQEPVLAPAQAMVQNADPEHESDMSLEEAVAGLEAKLKQSDTDPQGWMLYARSLMNLQRYDEAITAYEKVLKLTDNHPNVLKEFNSAQAYIAQQQGVAGMPSPSTVPAPGPSPEQMRDAAAMTPEERQAMIQGMVDGLAARLVESPNDPEGWSRLLRARKVLGQEEQALKDIAIMRKVFKNDSTEINNILLKSGWSE